MMFKIIYSFEILLKRVVFFLKWKKIFKIKKIPIWKKYKINSIKKKNQKKINVSIVGVVQKNL